MKSSVLRKQTSRQGLTLVEVVAGIALLSMLLVLILGSYRVHSAQIRNAKERMRAIELADELLSVWMSGSNLPRVGQEELLPGTPGWFWRMIPSGASADLELLGAKPVQLQIVATDSGTSRRVLTSVELLVSMGAVAK